MEPVNVYVFDKDLVLIGVVDVVTSLTWVEKFANVGSFDLWCPLTDANVEILQEDNVLWIGGKTAGIIEMKQLSTDSEDKQINVQGRLSESYLDYRTVYPELYLINEPVAGVMYKLVERNVVSPADTNRKIQHVELGEMPSSTGEAISYRIKGSNVLTECSGLGNAYRIGFYMQFLPKEQKFSFQMYNPIDRTINQNSVDPVFFASDLDDILDSSYMRNRSSLRNASYVAGDEDEQNPQITVPVYAGTTPSGLHRRELYIDAGDISRIVEYAVVTTITRTLVDGSDKYFIIRVNTSVVKTNTVTGSTITESSVKTEISDTVDTGTTTEESTENLPMPEDEYRALLTSRGKTTLQDYYEVESFNATLRTFGVTSYEYGVDFFLGDKVTVYDRLLKVRADAVVTSVTTTYSSSGKQLDIALGYEQPTVSEKLRKAGV